MVRGYKIRIDACGDQWLWADSVKSVCDGLEQVVGLDELSTGERVTIEAVEITEHERDTMPDFDGW
jgi:hypothetical protein